MRLEGNSLSLNKSFSLFIINPFICFCGGGGEDWTEIGKRVGARVVSLLLEKFGCYASLFVIDVF